MGEALAEHPPRRPVVGEALGDRLRALVPHAQAVRHPRFDQQAIPLRKLRPMLHVLRPDGGIDAGVPVVAREGVSPVGEPEGAVLGERALERLGRGAPASFDDLPLAVEKCPQRGDGSRRDGRQARRRCASPSPDLAEERPRRRIGERGDVVRRRSDRHLRDGIAAVRRMKREIDPHAVAEAKHGAAQGAARAEPSRERDDVPLRRRALRRRHVREHRQRVRRTDAIHTFEVRAERDRQLAAQPRERGVRA